MLRDPRGANSFLEKVTILRREAKKGENREAKKGENVVELVHLEVYPFTVIVYLSEL